ncbi:MAG: hypothetical protein LRY39_00190 [Alphaproteobacteria bacterium]|nr:hypothetical protein [Alphaproteobacteria bacterium]
MRHIRSIAGRFVALTVLMSSVYALPAGAQDSAAGPDIQAVQGAMDAVNDDATVSSSATPDEVEAQNAAPLPLGNAPETLPGMAAEGDAAIMTAETAPVDMGQAVDVESLPSLFFTFWEHNALKDALNARGVARTTTESELVVPEMAPRERVKPPPEEREIRLGGILFTRKGDWTIWLNNKRVTPDALPSEAIELRVYKDYVEMKWLDDYTQRIYPIRLRPHQRFNLDSRIFLPG